MKISDKTSAESLKTIKELVEHRWTQFESCLLQMFAIKDQDEYVPYFGRYLFLDHTPEARNQMEYGEGFEVYEILTINSAIDRIEEIATSGVCSIGGHELTFEGQLRNDLWFGRSRLMGFNPSDGSAFGHE